MTVANKHKQQIQSTYPREQRSKAAPDKAYRGRTDDFQGSHYGAGVENTHGFAGDTSRPASEVQSGILSTHHLLRQQEAVGPSCDMTWVVDAAFVIQDQGVGHHYYSAWIFIFLKGKLNLWRT